MKFIVTESDIAVAKSRSKKRVSTDARKKLLEPVNNDHQRFVKSALGHLKRCKKMGSVITVVGHFELTPYQPKDYFWILVRSIVGQMLSLKAANTIYLRLEETLKPKKVTPEAILNLTAEQLRNVGLSNTKAYALRDLAKRSLDNRLPLKRFQTMPDEEIIEALIDVKGIGKWTAEMFLIFALVRPDVWPINDLGIRAAIRKMDGLNETPDSKAILLRADIWKPYRSVASWYLWQSLKNS